MRAAGLTALLLGTCAVVLASCGGDAAAVSKAKALEYASQVNLRDSDVPGMAVLTKAFERGIAPPISGCKAPIGRSQVVSAAESARHLRSESHSHEPIALALPVPPVEAAHSIVFVMRDPAVASQSVAAARGAAAAACVSAAAASESDGRRLDGERYKQGVTASALHFPLPGVDGFGLRISGTYAAAAFHQKTRTPYYEDSFGFAVGPAEVVLDTVGVGRPYPPAQEHRLLGLLYQRAKARELP